MRSEFEEFWFSFSFGDRMEMLKRLHSECDLYWGMENNSPIREQLLAEYLGYSN